MLSWEWRCSWSSANRWYSNYIWVVNKFIADKGAPYIRDFTAYIYVNTHASSIVQLASDVFICMQFLDTLSAVFKSQNLISSPHLTNVRYFPFKSISNHRGEDCSRRMMGRAFDTHFYPAKFLSEFHVFCFQRIVVHIISVYQHTKTSHKHHTTSLFYVNGLYHFHSLQTFTEWL